MAFSQHEDVADDISMPDQVVAPGSRSPLLNRVASLLRRRRVRRFSRFALVGGLTFTVNLGVLFASTDLLGLHYMVSMLLSVIVTNLLGFVLNRQWTFGTAKTSLRRDARRYLTANLLSMLAAMASMAVLVDLVHVQYLLASTLLAVLFLLANFFMHGKWTFRAL